MQAIGKAIEKKINSDEAVVAVKNGTAEPEKEKKVAKKKEEDVGAAKKSKDKAGAVQNQKAKDSKTKTDKGDGPKRVSRQTSKDSDSSKTKPKATKKPTDAKKTSEKIGPRAPREKKITEEPITEKENNPVAVNASEIKDDNEKTIEPLESGYQNGKEFNDVNKQQRHSGKVRPPVETISKEENSKENSAIQKEENERESDAQPEKQSEQKPEKEIEIRPPSIPNSATSGNKNVEQIEPLIKASEVTSHSKVPERHHQNGHSKPIKPTVESSMRKKSSFIKPSSVNAGEPGPSVRSTTALRAPSARPPSARPGAPRRRDRNVEIIVQTEKTMHDAAEKNATNSNLVADLADDGENLVVIDNTDIQGDALPITAQQTPTDVVNEKDQGHLVQQILETQTTLSKAANDGDEIKRDNVRTIFILTKLFLSYNQLMNKFFITHPFELV